MDPNDIQIVAASARTPVGLAAENVAAALRAGISRVRLSRAPAFDDGTEWFFALDSLLDPGEISGAARIAEMGRSALADVLRKIARPGRRFDGEIAVLLGLPEERPGWAAREIDRVRTALAAVDVPQVRLRVEVRPQGHAVALALVPEAQRLLHDDRTKVVIVGGADSYHDPETLAWLQENRQWLGEDSRSAFAPGEGAAFVALMRDEDARRLEVPEGPEVLGVGIASEARLIKSDDTCLGEGLTAAVGRAIASLQSPTEIVDDVHCDINGERYRAEEWGFVAAPAFVKIIEASGMQCASARVSASTTLPEGWACAAKQIIEKVDGHRPIQLIERWFAPIVRGLRVTRGPRITFSVIVEDPATKNLSVETRTQRFTSAENVPSCDRCQKNLAAIFCDTQCG